jgi:hypothetical protein
MKGSPSSAGGSIVETNGKTANEFVKVILDFAQSEGGETPMNRLRELYYNAAVTVFLGVYYLKGG